MATRKTPPLKDEGASPSVTSGSRAARSAVRPAKTPAKSKVVAGRIELTKTAVLYLRVSTLRQARRGGEAEGYSLPAQRIDCIHKAVSLGAEVLGEFVERGESAKTADRTVLKELLERISLGGTIDARTGQVIPKIDYVLVHKVDRWARNSGDDALLTREIKAAGTQSVPWKTLTIRRLDNWSMV